ncbi:MAG: TIGR01212 family radical SAM protein [Eubacteriales bacterium]|nr:TIGR01212 family radical SAM protein [Eubacteriales bacterium]
MTPPLSPDQARAGESAALPAASWYGKPYYSLDAWCKNTYGQKLYKVALDAGCTCPNRDGTLGSGGCIFCSAGGSGDFAAAAAPTIREQIDNGKRLLEKKWHLTSDTPCLIAYFQSYTNTYGDPDRLGRLYEDALSQPDVAGISIATRPDCLPSPILRKLDSLHTAYPGKFIWIELGLQTIHDRTAAFLHRGYPAAVFEEAMYALDSHGIPAIVHTILGLPGESKADVLATMDALNRLHPFGVKLQLLHILKGTPLAKMYESGQVAALSRESYLDLVTTCISALSPDICIHRITGDGPRKLLLAPDWSLQKKDVLNSIHALMKQKGIRQGSYFYESGTTDTL